MRTVTRRGWKAAAAALGLTAAGYALCGPDPAATAQPPAPVNPMWMRSSSPLAPPAPTRAPARFTPGPVTPAAAVVPAAQPPVPPLPPLPAAPPASSQPTPVVIPSPAPVVTQPEFKAPAAKAPAVPALPTLVPPVPAFAPPAPPAKSALPVQPPGPAKADSPLRLPDGGTSVKSDAAWKAGPAGPAVAPPPREVTRPTGPAAPPAAVADRSKPPEVPVPPSERDVFPLPRPAAPAVAVAAPAAPIPLPAPMPLPPPPPVVPPPAAKTDPVATTPGADPMTFKSTAAAAVLGGALALPQTKADAQTGGASDPPAGKDAAKTTDQKLLEIQRSIDRLTELLDGRKDETGARLPSDPGIRKEVRDLKDQLDALEKQFNTLKITSLRPPAGGTNPLPGSVPGLPNPMPGAGGAPGPAVPPAAAGTGTVRVVNEYPVEVTMVVNGRSYRVAPNATQDITLPAGDFSYQLLSGSTALAPTRSTIRDREVVTLRIK